MTSHQSHHLTSPHITSHDMTLHYIKLCDTKLGNIPWIEWHYIAKHCVTFTTPPLISPCVAYLCVWVSVSESVCVRTWTRKHVLTDETQMIPAAWSQPGLNPRGEDRGGGRRGKGKGKWGSQFDIINHAEQGVAKQVRRETSRQLCPLSAQIIVKAKPTPTSKLHSVTNLICKQKQALELEHCQKTNIRSRVSIYPVEERKLTQYFS